MLQPNNSGFQLLHVANLRGSLVKELGKSTLPRIKEALQQLCYIQEKQPQLIRPCNRKTGPL